jgi:DNA primase large subunit
MELQTLAKYPFLKETKEYVIKTNLTIEELDKHPIYSAAINLGKQRILDLLNNKFKPELDDKTSMELLMLSYPTARILVNQLGNNIVSARYANAEAEHAYEQLRKESKSTIEKIKEDLGLKIDEKIEVSQYLRLATSMVKKDVRWKLINKTVEKGFVKLDHGEELILMKEAIRQKVLEPLKIKTTPKSMQKALNELKGTFTASLEEAKVEFLEERALPKCMTHIMSMLQAGMANHNSRFILATFLIGLGLKEEEIAKIFSKSPNFDEEKTRYQIQFLAGQKSNTKYTCPACITIKSYGLCKTDCKVKHPQQYYRNKSRE